MIDPVEGCHRHSKLAGSIFGGGFELDVACQAFEFGFPDPWNFETKIQWFVIQYLYFCQRLMGSKKDHQCHNRMAFDGFGEVHFQLFDVKL